MTIVIRKSLSLTSQMSEIHQPEILKKLIEEDRQGEVFISSIKNKSVSQTEEIFEQANQEATRKFYIESYGCAMNFSDSEIVSSVLINSGFASTQNFLDADLILINTCSIRENAELRVRARLSEFKKAKRNNPDALIGVLGCMAERLKSKFLEEEKIVDLVVGPDAYRDLPNLVSQADDGQRAINVLLSREETYADINPVRLNSNGITAFISIMRGCNNMCSFCVVPFTRGRERSRDAHSIIREAKQLFSEGYREVTLLGQNVDSYLWTNEITEEEVNFPSLLEMVALVNPLLRVRFSTSHPKDITDDVLFMIKKYPNICKSIHLPLQSGSSRILEMMNRTYNREWYKNKIDRIHEVLPECSITTDVIVGFCSETEDDHNETVSMMEYASYDMAFMFKYSERPGTPAEKKFSDDVPEEIKSRRLQEIVDTQMKRQFARNKNDLGKTFEILVEGFSKKNKNELFGRSSQNQIVVFPKGNFKPGNYVSVKVIDCTSATLIGEFV
jgi:tRNA-2-methylthio-N6-dimethylallyladenosine synthase